MSTVCLRYSRKLTFCHPRATPVVMNNVMSIIRVRTSCWELSRRLGSIIFDPHWPIYAYTVHEPTRELSCIHRDIFTRCNWAEYVYKYRGPRYKCQRLRETCNDKNDGGSIQATETSSLRSPWFDHSILLLHTSTVRVRPRLFPMIWTCNHKDANAAASMTCILEC
jgi:hypothetical protein